MPDKKKDSQLRWTVFAGWSAIVAGSILFVYIPPANKLFFGRFWLEDTFEKELLNICLIAIGWLVLQNAKLSKKIKDLETQGDSDLH